MGLGTSLPLVGVGTSFSSSCLLSLPSFRVQLGKPAGKGPSLHTDGLEGPVCRGPSKPRIPLDWARSGLGFSGWGAGVAGWAGPLGPASLASYLAHVAVRRGSRFPGLQDQRAEGSGPLPAALGLRPFLFPFLLPPSICSGSRSWLPRLDSRCLDSSGHLHLS